ncbi:MAG TPA: DUF1615 domain-containing protein [Usitatibacter sp.]|nr:DUF1615 domain-containing protein [Usitatibacter sp.]
MRTVRYMVTVVALLAGCATGPEAPRGPPVTAEEARARIAAHLPPKLPDAKGWATDIYAAMASLGVAPSVENICAIVAVTEQESGFKANPEVAGLSAIAWKEIERQRESVGIPKLILDAALLLPSSDGRSYRDRIDAARTELDLSDAYEDMIGRVPLARRFLEDRNPVRTAGPMQVSVAFAQSHARSRPYPYPVATSLRQELFTRRGGMYFGIAHLMDYPAGYDAMIHRFADYNAGHYASRNAAFQKALAEATGIPLDLDGDLVRMENGSIARDPGSTERAARVLGQRIGMDEAQVRRDLEHGAQADFARTRLYQRVFDYAEAKSGKSLPRETLPQIPLKSAKIRRSLTTEWFAKRVDTRYRACLAR